MKKIELVFITKLIFSCLLAVSMAGCGNSSDTVFATGLVANAPLAHENGTYGYTSLDKCTNDPDTGLFEAKFSTGVEKPSMEVKIKGFTLTDSTYTCTQASDNTTSGVGQKFNSCGLIVKTLFDTSAEKLNTYTMYRDSAAEEAFTYAGNCTISITYSEPRVSGTVSCTKLIQTQRNGAPRNPIDASVTLDLTSGTNFFCDV